MGAGQRIEVPGQLPNPKGDKGEAVGLDDLFVTGSNELAHGIASLPLGRVNRYAHAPVGSACQLLAFAELAEHDRMVSTVCLV